MYGIMINEKTKPFIHEHTKQICEFQGGAVLVLNDKNEPTNVVLLNEWDHMVDPGGNTYLYGDVTDHLKKRFGIFPEYQQRTSSLGYVGPWQDGLGQRSDIDAVFNAPDLIGAIAQVTVTYTDGSTTEYRKNL